MFLNSLEKLPNDLSFLAESDNFVFGSAFGVVGAQISIEPYLDLACAIDSNQFVRNGKVA